MKTTADRLMQLAKDAEDEAARLLRLLDPDLSDTARTQVFERVSFHYGQASGFRQSAYYAAISEGTRAND
jgi:hypothetical protein